MLTVSLSNVNWRRAAGIAGAVSVVLLFLFVRLQEIELRRTRAVTERYVAAYQHPRIVERTRTVTIEGPIRIVTRVVESDGHKETVTTEEHGAVVHIGAVDFLSDPILPPSETRHGGFLTGISWEHTHWREREGWTLWAGYSLMGRLDMSAGYSGRNRLEFMTAWRW